jgi:integrase
VFVSLKAFLPFKLSSVRFASGEHRAFLVDELGIPEAYSTLYCTMRVRNAHKSLATQQAALGAVNVLYAHARDRGIDVVEMLRRGEVLDGIECEALQRSVQRDYGPASKKQAKVLALGGGKRGHRYGGKVVKPGTQYIRLTYIADFLKWLGEYFARNKGSDFIEAVGRMVLNIQALRPFTTTRGISDNENATEFTREHYRRLATALTPGHPDNPFEPEVQLRNLVLVDLMALLGERRGAVLNLRVGDINFGKSQVSIIRRAGSRDDRRANQPRVKTLERTVPVGPALIRLLGCYVDQRRDVPGARKHPYLAVVHKPGPTLGQPMSISSLNAVFATINEADLGIPRLMPHKLRHFNGTSLADEQLAEQATQETRETDRRVRNFLAGRRPESEVDALYIEHATRREAERVSIQHQQVLANSDPKREAQLTRIAEKLKNKKGKS